jgi:hypothetical protein
MRSVDINTTLIDGYIRLLENLSPSSKLDLISKLILSVKHDITKRKRNFFKSYGALETEQSADQIANEIRKSRNLTRQIEEF